MAVPDPTPRSAVRRVLAAVVAAVVLCALAAAPASAASSFHTAGPEFARAVGVAQAHWGSLPCGGQIAFGWRSESRSVNATSYWSLGPYGATNCEVVFNREAGMDWIKFCTVLTHELGHLHGHDHAANRNDLMSAIYSGDLPACAAASPDPPAPAAAPAPAPEPAPAAKGRKASVPRTFQGVFLDRAPARSSRRTRSCKGRAAKRSRKARARCAPARRKARSRRRAR